MTATTQAAIRERSRHGRLTTAALILAVLSPVLLAFAILYRQAFDAPRADDYHAILAFAAEYEHTPGLANKILLIAAAQHNEYKLVFEHLIVAVEISLTHRVNFSFLIALGNFFLLPIGYLLWLTYREEGKPLDLQLLHFLPISLVFFSLTYWETTNWAMAALTNLAVILFGFLAVFLLAAQPSNLPTPARFAFACLSATLAAFSSANGFLLAPVGLLILLPRRAYGAVFAWSAAFVVPLAAYLYQRRPYNPVSHPIGSLVWVARPLTFLSFLGGAAQSVSTAVPLGIAILVVGWLAFRSRFDVRKPAAFYFTFWIFITAAVASWVRGTGGIAFTSRYSIYSDLLVISCYAFLSHHLPARNPAFNARRFRTAAVSLAIVFCLWSNLRANEELSNARRLVAGGIAHYRANPARNSPLIDPAVIAFSKAEAAYERTQLTRAIELGLYSLPTDLPLDRTSH